MKYIKLIALSLMVFASTAIVAQDVDSDFLHAEKAAIKAQQEQNTITEAQLEELKQNLFDYRDGLKDKPTYEATRDEILD